jgi:hypothetical protein
MNQLPKTYSKFSVGKIGGRLVWAKQRSEKLELFGSGFCNIFPLQQILQTIRHVCFDPSGNWLPGNQIRSESTPKPFLAHRNQIAAIVFHPIPILSSSYPSRTSQRAATSTERS